MKATLTFNLADESDAASHDMMLQAGGLHSALWELDSWLRSKIKHAPEGVPQNVLDAYQEVRDYLHNELNENDVRLV